MPQKYTKQNPDKLDENLAKKIEAVVSSEKTAEEISNICEKYGIAEEEKIENIAYQVAMVLLGKLLPEELPKTLEKKIRIDIELAEKISLEINHLIFSPIKDDLLKLYEKEGISVKSTETTSLPEEKPKRPPKKDIYREHIE